MRATRALIHRQHLFNNLTLIKDTLSPGTALCAAVKADAYGHGAVTVATLLKEAGVEAFGVATVEEALQLRAAGIGNPIFLFGTLQPDEIPGALEADMDLFVWSLKGVQALSTACRGRGHPLRVHLKVDTGMGRVGCRPEEAEDVAKAIVHALPLELAGVCTHFASSDGPSSLGVPEQLRRFEEVLGVLKARGWTPRYVHTANSGAIVGWPSTHFNLVRPGIVLYGYALGYVPVMELVSKVGFVKTVPKGTPLSYGSKYTTTQSTDVATIPLGYADGYRRAWSNQAPVWIDNRIHHVSGTVCMDQFMVDLGPNSKVKEGDPVVLFGPPSDQRSTPAPTAADLATLAGTISYEVLCGISARVPRIVV